MRTSTRRTRRISGLALIAVIGAVAGSVGAQSIKGAGPPRRDARPKAMVVPRVKTHTVQEGVFLTWLLHGPGSHPRILKHTVQEEVPDVLQCPIDCYEFTPAGAGGFGGGLH